MAIMDFEEFRDNVKGMERFPGEGEIVDRLFLSFTKNEDGEEVLEKERRLVKWLDKYFVEENRLVRDYPGGPTKYKLRVVQEVSQPRDVDEAKEMMLRD